MTTALEEEVRKRRRPGRLNDGESEARAIAGSGQSASPAIRLRTTSLMTCRRVARATAAPRFCARISARLPGQARRIGLAPFHMEVDYVSRERAGWSMPASCRRGRRVAVFPATPWDVAIVENVGKYNQACRVWTVKSGHPFLGTPKGRALQLDLAAVARELWRAGKGAARSRKSAAGYQAYIERFNLEDDARSAEIEADDLGLISTGNLGDSTAERLRFWQLVDRFEQRHDARLQNRVVFELPHWISAGERREIVEKFGKIFADRGLGYWVVVHRPGPDGDRRNFHGHLAYHERPVIWRTDKLVTGSDDQIQVVRGDPLFADKKDRTVQGGKWVEFLRREYAQIVNDVLIEHVKRTQRMPPWFFYPGGYEDLGIHIQPQQHLGPRGFAMLRKGTATNGAIDNLEALEAGIAAREERAISSIRRSMTGRLVQLERLPGPIVGDDTPDSVLAEFEQVVAEAMNISRLLSDLHALQTAPTTEQSDTQLAGLLDEGSVAEFELPHRPLVPATEIAETSPADGTAPSTHATTRRFFLIALASLCLIHKLEVKAAHLDALLAGEHSESAGTVGQAVAPNQAIRIVDDLHVGRSTERAALLLGARRDNDGRWTTAPGLGVGAHRRLLELFGSADAEIAKRAEEAYTAQATARLPQLPQSAEPTAIDDRIQVDSGTQPSTETSAEKLQAPDDLAPVAPLDSPAVPPSPAILPEAPELSEKSKPVCRYVDEVSRTWILDKLEAQIKEVQWIRNPARQREKLERSRGGLLVRISDIPTFSIRFRSPDGWAVEQIDELGKEPAGGWKHHSGAFEISPELWLRALKSALHQVALCLDPDDVRRHIVAAGFEVPKPRGSFYRFVDGPATLLVRKDAGRFQMQGHSEQLEPLFQSLLKSRARLEARNLRDNFRPIAKLVLETIHELGFTDQLEARRQDGKSHLMLDDFDFCKARDYVVKPISRPKKKLSNAERNKRRETDQIPVILLETAATIETHVPPAIPAKPATVTLLENMADAPLPERKVDEIDTTHLEADDGKAVPTDRTASAPALASTARKIWNWIFGSASRTSTNEPATSVTQGVPGAHSPSSSGQKDLGSYTSKQSSTTPTELGDMAQSGAQSQRKAKSAAARERELKAAITERVLALVHMGQFTANDAQVEREIRPLSRQFLRKYRNELDKIRKGYQSHQYVPVPEASRSIGLSISHVRGVVQSRMNEQFYEYAGWPEQHVRQREGHGR